MANLTKSAIDKQNVLNNKFAVDKLQEQLGLSGMLFKEEYKFTLNQIIAFFEVSKETVSRYLSQFEAELKHNGYELLKGQKLKEFKLNLDIYWAME